MSSRDLPVDRLSTTDENGNRLWLYLADVRGRFKNLRLTLGVVLILLFFILPWLKIGGHQAVLLDIPHRRFAIFGLTFWAHEAPMLVFVFGGAAVLLTFVTAVWGRVWCGWACPQTVFVDNVFRRIERWIEGDGVRRRLLDESPWGGLKLLKKISKWALFVLVSLLISHSLLAFFVGTEELMKMMRTSPFSNPVPFFIMTGVSSWVLFDFGWFREQFCTMVCPYGRFQSVLMDDRSMVVHYDAARGEPRRGAGDCVDCHRCVQVCPAGIDIRRGIQLECVSCTACIDACDEVMYRQAKPKGLIRYTKARLTPRALMLLALVVSMSVALGVLIHSRKPLEAQLLRGMGAPFLEHGDEILNHYRVDLRNLGFTPLAVSFALPPELEKKGAAIANVSAPVLPGGAQLRVDLMIRVPRSSFVAGRLDSRLLIRAEGGRELLELSEEVPLVGPYR